MLHARVERRVSGLTMTVNFPNWKMICFVTCFHVGTAVLQIVNANRFGCMQIVVDDALRWFHNFTCRQWVKSFATRFFFSRVITHRCSQRTFVTCVTSPAMCVCLVAWAWVVDLRASSPPFWWQNTNYVERCAESRAFDVRKRENPGDMEIS